MHGSNNRFPNDSQLTQALGQMFSRGGLKVNGVEVLPYNVYAPGATARKYSLFVFSYGSVASSSLNGLSGVLATYDKEAGTGSLNRARYSNPAFDALLKQAASGIRRSETQPAAGRCDAGGDGGCGDTADLLAEALLGCAQGLRRRSRPW